MEKGPEAQLMMLNGTTEGQDLGRQSGNWGEGKPGQAIFRKSQLPNAAVERRGTLLTESHQTKYVHSITCCHGIDFR